MANNAEVKFIDTSAEVKKTLEELAKAALRNGGKIVRKAMRKNIPTNTKRIKYHIASWVRIDKKTGQPQLDVGYYTRSKVMKRGKKPSSLSPHWIEFGAAPHIIRIKRKKALSNGSAVFGKLVHHPGMKAQHPLRKSVYDNIDAIQSEQRELLKTLNGTVAAAEGKTLKGEAVDDEI